MSYNFIMSFDEKLETYNICEFLKYILNILNRTETMKIKVG